MTTAVTDVYEKIRRETHIPDPEDQATERCWRLNEHPAINGYYIAV